MTLVTVPPALRAGIVCKTLGCKDVRRVGQIGVVRAEGVRAHRHLVIRHTHRDPAAARRDLQHPALGRVGDGKRRPALAGIEPRRAQAVARDELADELHGAAGRLRAAEDQKRDIVRLEHHALPWDRFERHHARAGNGHVPVVRAAGPRAVERADLVFAGGIKIAAGLADLGDRMAADERIYGVRRMLLPRNVREKGGRIVPVVVGGEQRIAAARGAAAGDKAGTHRLCSSGRLSGFPCLFL